MSAAVHFFIAVACMGVWMAIGLAEEKVPEGFWTLCYRGTRAGVLSIAIAVFIAVLLSHSPWVVVPDDSRTFVFAFFSVGLSLIALPIGFMSGVAKARREAEEAQSFEVERDRAMKRAASRLGDSSPELPDMPAEYYEQQKVLEQQSHEDAY